MKIEEIERLLRWRREPAIEESLADPELEETRPCPHCGRPVSRGATVCLYCEEEIASLMSFGEFARRFGSPHSGGPPPAPLEEPRS